MPCLNSDPGPTPPTRDRYEPCGFARLWITTATPWERLLSSFALGPPPPILLSAWGCKPWLYRLIAHRRARHWSQHWVLRRYTTQSQPPTVVSACRKVCKVRWIRHRQ